MAVYIFVKKSSDRCTPRVHYTVINYCHKTNIKVLFIGHYMKKKIHKFAINTNTIPTAVLYETADTHCNVLVVINLGRYFIYIYI